MDNLSVELQRGVALTWNTLRNFLTEPLFHFKTLGGSGVQLGVYSLYAGRVKWDNVEENNTDEKNRELKNTSLSQTCLKTIIEQYRSFTSETAMCVWWKNLSKILPCRYFLIPGNFPRSWLDICQTPFRIWFFGSRQHCTLFQHCDLNERKLFKMHPHDIPIKLSSCKIFFRAFFIRNLPKLLNGFQNMTIV